jgi:hypothetical protein
MSDPTEDGANVKTGFSLAKWLCVEPALEAMNRGPVLRQALGFLVQGAACLMALLFFIDWCRSWGVLRHMGFVEGVGFLLVLLGLFLGGFFALQTMFVRGRQIRGLPESDYVVAPIAGMLAAMAGEMAFVFLAFMSVPVMLAVWCDSRYFPLPLLWDARGENVFLDGLSLFLSCWVTGFLALVAGRWIKEWVLVVLQIASDVRSIRKA